MAGWLIGGRPLLALVTLLLSAACYLVFAGQVSSTEVVAAVPASGLVAAFAVLRQRGQDRPMRLQAPWGRLLRSMASSLLRDTLRVGAHLAACVFAPRRCSGGTIDRQPFRPGGPDPADAGRRAIVTVAVSFAPNGFVLDVEPSVLLGNGQTLLVHHLVPSPAAADREWPL